MVFSSPRLSTPPDSRLLVGIAGIPASGKSCLARTVVEKFNRILEEDSAQPFTSPAILIGLDGWHLTRAQLDAMPNPKEAHDRRGAHWTYDGEGYASFVAAIRKPLLEIGQEPIRAPTFDHAKKDPEFDAIAVLPHHRLVIIEGQFAFVSHGAWKSAGEAMDERWYIEVGEEEATRRILIRHVQTGIARDTDEARWRAENNDMPSESQCLELFST